MLSKYEWRIKEPITKDIISQYPEINPIIVQLLWNRDIKIYRILITLLTQIIKIY